MGIAIATPGDVERIKRQNVFDSSFSRYFSALALGGPWARYHIFASRSSSCAPLSCIPGFQSSEEDRHEVSAQLSCRLLS